MPAVAEPPKQDPLQRPPASAPTRVVRWTYWPLRDRFSELWWAPVGAIALAWLTEQRLESLACAVAVAISFALCTLTLWLPVGYSISESGIEVRWLGQRRHVRWSNIQSQRFLGDRVLLDVHESSSAHQAPISESIQVRFRSGDVAAQVELKRLLHETQNSAA